MFGLVNHARDMRASENTDDEHQRERTMLRHHIAAVDHIHVQAQPVAAAELKQGISKQPVYDADRPAAGRGFQPRGSIQ